MTGQNIVMTPRCVAAPPDLVSDEIRSTEVNPAYEARLGAQVPMGTISSGRSG